MSREKIFRYKSLKFHTHSLHQGNVRFRQYSVVFDFWLVFLVAYVSTKNNMIYIVLCIFDQDMGKPPIPKAKQKEIARERIATLFTQAAETFPKNKTLANRYITLARKLAMKVKIRIPLQYKRRFCKHCYAFLQPGVNSRTRTRDGKIIISCLECKKFTRIPTTKRRKTL